MIRSAEAGSFYLLASARLFKGKPSLDFFCGLSFTPQLYIWACVTKRTRFFPIQGEHVVYELNSTLELERSVGQSKTDKFGACHSLEYEASVFFSGLSH